GGRAARRLLSWGGPVCGWGCRHVWAGPVLAGGLSVSRGAPLCGGLSSGGPGLGCVPLWPGRVFRAAYPLWVVVLCGTGLNKNSPGLIASGLHLVTPLPLVVITLTHYRSARQ